MDNSVKKLSDNRLFIEHDVLKTIIYKLPYQDPKNIRIVTEEFGNSPDFKNLSSNLISVDALETLDRFIGLGIISPLNIDKTTRIEDLQVLSIAIQESKLRRYLIIIESEILLRKKGQRSIRKLTFNLKKGLISFKNSTGVVKKAKIGKSTNEFMILQYLANNTGSYFETSELVQFLKDARNNADFVDQKQRVIDKIKVLRKKLGKEVIRTTANGYAIDCEVVMV